MTIADVFSEKKDKLTRAFSSKSLEIKQIPDEISSTSEKYVSNSDLSEEPIPKSNNGHDNLAFDRDVNDPESPKISQTPQNISDTIPKKHLLRQCLAVGGMFLASLCIGLTAGQSSSMLPQIDSLDSTIRVDTETASWIASITALPTIIGSFIGGWLMETFGRRNAFIIATFPFSIGFIMIPATDYISVVLLGRLICGLSFGTVASMAPAFIGEITHPDNRSVFTPTINLATALGILVVNVLGSNLGWRLASCICAIFPIISIEMLMHVKESPVWYLKNGRISEGTASFLWYRGESQKDIDELNKTIDTINADRQNLRNFKEKVKMLKTPEVWKPTMINMVVFLTIQLTGVNTVIFYANNLIGITLGNGFDVNLAVVIVDTLRLVMSGLSSISVRFLNRRPLGLIGCWSTDVVLFALVAYLFFASGSSESSSLSWIPLILFVLYVSLVTVFLVALPWTLMGELFPSHSRGFCSAICSAVAFTGFFIITKLAPLMFDDIGPSGTFLTYGILNLIGSIIIYFVLPETRGKSLVDIEHYFKTTTTRF